MCKTKLNRFINNRILASLISIVAVISAILLTINFSELSAFASELAGAFPVDITADGQTVRIYTQGQSVETLLNQANISLGLYDKVYPDADTLVSGATTINVIRVQRIEEIVSGELPFQTITRNSDSLEKGKSLTVQNGSAGKYADVYETLTFENGEKVCNFIYRVTLVEPVPEIIEVGTKEPKKTVKTSAGTVMSYTKCIKVKSTAYTTEGRKYARTATGTVPKVGTIAVDPKVIPLGSKVYITSTDGKWVYGLATAEDTGGKIKNNKIDLFFNTKKECFSHGVRDVLVYILE